MNITMDELINKGIRPVDIAKILDVDKSEVIRKVNTVRKAEKESQVKRDCCDLIINLTSCNDATAMIVFETIKEMLKRG